MGGVEDNEPPTKRVKVFSGESSEGPSNRLPLREQGSCSSRRSMARVLASQDNEEVVGQNGVVRKVELVRIIAEALYSLGYSKSGARLEEESGIPLHSSAVELFMYQVLEGQWDESVSMLREMGLADEKALKLATFLIFEKKFFELLGGGKTMDALRILRTEIASLGVNHERVRELASFVLFPPRNLVDGIKDKESRKELLEKLREILPPALMIPENRLVHLLEQALVLQKGACRFHNSSVGKMSLLADHKCGRDHIPSQTLQKCDLHPLTEVFLLSFFCLCFGDAQILKEHNNEVWFLQFSHDGKYLASSSGDGLVVIWEVSADGHVFMKYEFSGHEKPVSYISWSPDNNQLLTCGLEETIKMWDVASGECLCTYQKNGVGMVSCAWDPHSKTIFSGATDKSIIMWDLEGNELDCWKGQRTTKISDLGVIMDGKMLVTVCKENAILLFEWETKTERFIEEDHPIISFSLSKNNKFLLVSLLNEELHVWSVDGATELVAKYRGHKRARFVVRSCFGGLDEAFIASGSEDSQVCIWHRLSGELILKLAGHSGAVNCVSWNPANPHMLASASDDRTIRIWGLNQVDMNYNGTNSNGVHHCNGERLSVVKAPLSHLVRTRFIRNCTEESIGKMANEAAKKKQKKPKFMQESENVSEVNRIRFVHILEQFRHSKDDVYKFEENLNNREREAVHTLCRKMGMQSKSYGKGQQRRLFIYKNKKGVLLKEKERLASFSFSEESRAALQDLFSQYPPNDLEMAENKFGESSGINGKVQAFKDDMFCKPAMTQSEIASKVESLASRIEKSADLRQITEERSKLPIASFRDSITSTMESHQVMLICGETGCGKTTQWQKELLLNEIRLESKGGSHSSLMFCTNGILLRILVGRGSGRKKKSKKSANSDFGITHIIVDEIHERDRFSDIMLTIIRDMLPLYPQLRLVLMSATIDAERFSTYFCGCPIIRVPGFTYPVKSFYLEDVLSLVRSTETKPLACTKSNISVETSITNECRVALDEAIDLALSSDEFDPLLDLISSQGNSEVLNYQHSKTGVTPLMVFAGKGRVSDICMLLSLGVDCSIKSNAGNMALDYAKQENQGEAEEFIRKYMEKPLTNSEEDQYLLDKYLSNVDPELIDCVLIEQLLRRICIDSNDGAILVFLPGWDDINRTREKLQASPFFKDPSRFLIISLHSRVPLSEQKKVFKRPPSGCRKIVLSTNIAETSVTIEDVVYVLDSGRMKEKNYDPYNNVSTLQTYWNSKANMKQREGRAGRCQPGICYHLFSKLRAASLPDFQVPEIKRMPLEELCLQVKLINPSCKIDEFLQKTLDPPVHETIRNAVSVLQGIGALTPDDEKLTELGERLGALPVHPLTSKMLFLAILLNCLDPALTLACASDYKDPFILPMLPDEKKRAQSARSELASLLGGNGDQLAVIAAFDCWRAAKDRGEQSRFCSRYFVSQNTMRMLSQMRKQLERELVRHGFIPEDASRCSLNARDPGILHAVLVAGLYPMIGRVVLSGRRSLVETADGNRVRLHPFSTNARLSVRKGGAEPPLVVFDEITRGDGGMFIRDCSVVGPLPMLLLASEIVVGRSAEDDSGEESECEDDSWEEDRMDTTSVEKGERIMSLPGNSVKVLVDGWLPLESTALDVAQIYCLRERLLAAVFFKVKHPKKVLPEHLGASLYAIACILSYDGMSGISLPNESVDSLASMVSATDISGLGRVSTKSANQPSQNYLKSLLNSRNKSYQPPAQSLVPNANNMHMYGSAMHGPPAPNRNFFKRPRGGVRR
ncbi:ATP-dependent RNA helicase [Striga asiatica]|uniref:ATP-dependent RNA helicase n=1 Tax=Striga asiatica TaxID=4170 RepID=A0A5A7R8H8_STRAF|nr:ATP-dependent RNA helicase [Striga asiatica]